MQFVSTRGESKHLDFSDVVLGGLATDGGLAMPENMPKIDQSTLKEWKDLGYTDLAFNVISLFAKDIPAEDLRKLINAAYTEEKFGIEEIVS
ncbi:MAG: threonine synthase, partial [Wohlfahrtiimonas sp.]